MYKKSVQLPKLLPENEETKSEESNQADDFHLVQDDCEKEIYLILIVHGIGSPQQTQTNNKQAFDLCLDTLVKGGFIDCKYQFETVMIDWKTTVDQSDQR